MTTNPVIIVGAPRSGTSLLQKLLRECPTYGSVPREAQHIWGPHVHPSLTDWGGECASETILHDEAALSEIRQQFAAAAVSAESWQRMSRSRIAGSRIVKSVARLFPRKAVSALVGRGQTGTGGIRLVEKSVHAGLWLPLVDAVFPDARYLHIVRDPRKSVPSIVTGWRDAGRFVSFELPEPLMSPDVRRPSKNWCFPLPLGWREHVQSPLLSIATFQWRAINQSILDYFAAPARAGRCLIVRLEDLVATPAATLHSIRTHSNIPDHDYFDAFADGLPVINRGPSGNTHFDGAAGVIWDDVADVAVRLGYSR